MRRSIVVAVVAVPVACAAAALATFHADAGPPVVTSVTEGVEAGTGRRVVFLVGTNVNQIRGIGLHRADGTPEGTVKATLKSPNVVALRLPTGLGDGPYHLRWNAAGPQQKYVLAQAQPATGLEGLRVVRGRVNADGTLATGTGFTCSRFVAGNYGVSFDVDFAAAPTIVATAYDGFTDATASAHGATTFDFGISTRNNGATGDVGFSFIAIGPR